MSEHSSCTTPTLSRIVQESGSIGLGRMPRRWSHGGMALDSYVTLGRSGLRVSPLALGTMTFGTDHGWGMDPSEAHTILAEYLDRWREPDRHGKRLHPRPLRGDHRRLLRRPRGS